MYETTTATAYLSKLTSKKPKNNLLGGFFEAMNFRLFRKMGGALTAQGKASPSLIKGRVGKRTR